MTPTKQKKPATLTSTRYRLGYHLMPPAGWMNDPNGLSYFKGYYHLFYQYYPYASEWGPMHWGHARSKDLVHWETLPVALKPDKRDDGCFSGSAIVYDNKLWLVYTGHHLTNPKDPEEFYEDQNLAYSTDGIHFTKYAKNPVVTAPNDNSKDFRDPKVWQDNDTFYMVVGSQSTKRLGRVLLYKSTNMVDWVECGPLTESVDRAMEGFMWECPDFFRINGQDVLLMSPNGIEPVGEKYRNLNQTGYFLGGLDYKHDKLNRGQFEEIDHGHDFYATQTMLTPDGRRVMIAWMNAWDSPMPEKQDGWAGALTIPRELTIQDGRVFQTPIKELTHLRVARLAQDADVADQTFELPRSAEVNLKLANLKTATDILTITDGDHAVKLSADLFQGRLNLTRNTKDGERSARLLDDGNGLNLRLYVDTSSLEIFVNDGEATFTERVYWDDNPRISFADGVSGRITIDRLETDANTYTVDPEIEGEE